MEIHPPTLFLLLLKKVRILGFGIHIYRPKALLQAKCISKTEKGY